MPTYTYECTFCTAQLEQIRKIADRDRLTLCERCKRPLDRKIDAPGAVYAPTASGGATLRV